jgi:hypothetical protein
MALLNARDTALYVTLQHIIANHVALHQLSPLWTYTALGRVLAGLCAQQADRGAVPALLVADIGRWLRTLLREPCPPACLPLPFDDDELWDKHDPRQASHSRELTGALCTLLNEYGQEQVEWEVGWRVVLHVLTAVIRELLTLTESPIEEGEELIAALEAGLLQEIPAYQQRV